MSKYEHVLDAEGIYAVMEDAFPQAVGFGRIERIGDGELEMTLEAEERYLRPGGTVSGPTLMTLADTAAYYLVLSLIGPVALAVTTSLHIDFLRKPKPGQVRAVARMLKLGKRLVIARVDFYSDSTAQAAESSNDEGQLVAAATVTYSVPPR